MKKNLFLITASVFLLTASYAGQKTTIRIGYPSVGTLINGQVGLVLEKTDILDNNGLNGEVTAFQYGPQLQEALLSGKVDVIFTSETNVVKVLAKGYPGACIASLGSGGRLGLLVSSASKAGSILDLRGKTATTVFGSSVHTPIIRWAKEAGLSPGRDINIINMDGGESRLALMRGDIDALMTWDPYIEDMLRKGQAKLLKQAPMYLAVVISKEFMKKNPEAVIDFLVSIKEAAYYMILNKKEVNKWYGDLCRIDPGLIDEASKTNKIYGDAKTFKDIDISVSNELAQVMSQTSAFLFEEKLISAKLDSSSIVDTEIVKKADKKTLKQKYDPKEVKVKDSKNKPFSK
ncbi:MAG: ABC transporter substrate-binding protein [Elusimicrobia bacterium]|nr:ABC transporter substrate-binding protein [Candidatus Liberimonas magnetica]